MVQETIGPSRIGLSTNFTAKSWGAFSNSSITSVLTSGGGFKNIPGT